MDFIRAPSTFEIFGSVCALLPVLYLFYTRRASSPDPPVTPVKEDKPIMQAPRTDLNPPKHDPFTLAQLKEFDGSDPSKPIYVSIKGTVFDVSHKRDVYGAGQGYNVFAGKDGSKGLGMSSLKPEDAIPDYSGLDEKDRNTLEDWHAFFSKRYNIIGKVTDMPSVVSNL